MITERVKEVLGIKEIPEPTNSLWKCFDDGSAEVAVLEFLYGLVRILRPERILETGTYWGLSSSFMALALKENGFGMLDTLEITPQNVAKAKEKWAKLEIQNFITEHLVRSTEFEPKQYYDFIFLDTEPEIRFEELTKFFYHLNMGGFILIHDLPRNMSQGNVNPDHPDFKDWPFGPLPQKIKTWLKDGALVKFHMPSPRGLVCFYKPHKGDYK